MAFTTGYKMLLRKGGTAQSILAIALLVAIIASTNSIVNYLSLQSEILAGLVNPRGTYLILSLNSTATTDSQLPADLTAKLSNLSFVKNVLPQRMLTVNLTVNSSSRTVQVRGVGDVGGFLKARGAYLNGTAAKNWTEADAGEILARAFSVSLGEDVSLTVGERHIKVRVVGVFRSQTQSDAELVAPMETANMLAGNNDTVSLIEFSLKEGVDSREALGQIAQLLPENFKIVQAQQLKEFTLQINMQVMNFLNVWSIAVYAVVAAASYIAATRLITESSYELAMLTAIGAKKRLVFTLILAYTITIALLGSMLGIALGIAGTQTASTMLRWIMPSVDVTPFLEAEQALQMLLLTLASSVIGCIYPAVKSTRTKYMEQPL
jgi:ABC-type lipoprotein release transport system permease subunit